MLGTVAAPSPSRQTKRLLVFCDGTWQDSTGQDESAYPSNVTRLSRAISRYAIDENGNEVEQIVYYQKGVGTGMMDRAFGGVLGVGVSANIRSAYGFLAANYDEGDSIYIFGFSRGAYTARALAGLVADTGLLTKRGMDQFPSLYAIYYDFREQQYRAKTAPDATGISAGGAEGALEFMKALGPDMISTSAAGAIKIVGVWDTVEFHHPEVLNNMRVLEMMGVESERVEFADIHVPERVQYAFHALSLDETRKAYLPTMWTLPKEKPKLGALPGLEDTDRRPILKQVWFSGEHSDIGGGRTNHRLSDISLAWMVAECVQTGLLAIDPLYLISKSDSPPPSMVPSPVQRTVSPVQAPSSPAVSLPKGSETTQEEGEYHYEHEDAYPLDPAPWGTYYGSTNPKHVSFKDKAINGIERFAGTTQRRPLKETADNVWTNESFHLSVVDRVFDKTQLEANIQKGYPKDGEIYERVEMRGMLENVDASKLSHALDLSQFHYTGKAMEIVNWVHHDQEKENKKQGYILGRFGSKKKETKTETPVPRVYVPVGKILPVERLLKNRIRAADSDIFVDKAALRNLLKQGSQTRPPTLKPTA